MVLAIAIPRRLFTGPTSSGATLRLGMTTASASSTTAVLITTPGETPMPLRISINTAARGEGQGASKIYSPLAPFTLPLSLLSKLTLKQLDQFLDSVFGVVTVGFDQELCALSRLQHDHLHDAFSVGLHRLFAGFDHLNIGT